MASSHPNEDGPWRPFRLIEKAKGTTPVLKKGAQGIIRLIETWKQVLQMQEKPSSLTSGTNKYGVLLLNLLVNVSGGDSGKPKFMGWV